MMQMFHTSARERKCEEHGQHEERVQQESACLCEGTQQRSSAAARSSEIGAYVRRSRRAALATREKRERACNSIAWAEEHLY